MEILFYSGAVLLAIGFLIFLVFSILLIVRAFQTSVGWGLAYLFLVGIGGLAFVVTHWSRAGGPFLKSLSGAVIAGVGMAFISMGAPGTEIYPEPVEAEEVGKPAAEVEAAPTPGQTQGESSENPSSSDGPVIDEP